jgi:hypothetical protein
LPTTRDTDTIVIQKISIRNDRTQQETTNRTYTPGIEDGEVMRGIEKRFAYNHMNEERGGITEMVIK